MSFPMSTKTKKIFFYLFAVHYSRKLLNDIYQLNIAQLVLQISHVSVSKLLKRSKAVSKNVHVKQISTIFIISRGNIRNHNYTAVILHYEGTLLNLAARVMFYSQNCLSFLEFLNQLT